MPADDIVSQRWALCIRIADFAVWDQAKLDERLEPVAYAAHQAIPLLQQFIHAFADARIAEESRDELSRAIRLIAAGKAARDKDDLRFPRALRELRSGCGNIVCRKVSEHKNVRCDARFFKCTRRVIFAVRAREHGDKRAGRSRAQARLQP